MAAPALVALAHGSRDPRSAETITALVDEVRALRPDLRIEQAFLELSKPSFATVVNKLVRAGYDEIVVVPLLLTEAYHAKVDVPGAVAEAMAEHEGLQIRTTSILGLEPAFLEVLDVRMREALKAARVRELDALVLAGGRLLRPAGQPGRGPAGPGLGHPPQAAGHRGVRLGGAAGHRRGGARLPRRGPSPHRGRVAVPGAGLPARPGRRARPRGRRRGGLRTAGRPPRAGPHHPGPVRRRRRRARPRVQR